MPPVGPNKTNRYPSINTKHADIVCDSESEYHGESDDDHDIADHHTFPQLPNIPIVTPTNSFQSAEINTQSESAMIRTGDGPVTYGPTRTDGEVWPCFECTPPIFSSTWNSKHDVPPLKPRRKSPIVRMGNQSFQYIESLHLKSNTFPNMGGQDEEDSVDFSQPNSRPGSGVPSFAYCDSSTIGDISLSVIDENSAHYDPLDIFLEEMGDSYRNDVIEFPSTIVLGDYNSKGEGL